VKSAKCYKLEQTYHTLPEHIDLLTERGYLSENFKTAAKVGYWLREFAQQYEDIRSAAIVDDQVRRFQLSIGGKFNQELEQVNFLFRYTYSPATDALTLASVFARLGRASHTFNLPSDRDLPPAEAVYQYLRDPWGKENNTRMFIRLYFQFLKDRNPDNDFVEYTPAFRLRPRR
jgi:hypothetical protein